MDEAMEEEFEFTFPIPPSIIEEMLDNNGKVITEEGSIEIKEFNNLSEYEIKVLRALIKLYKQKEKEKQND